MGMINIQPKELESVIVTQLEKFKSKYQPWSAEIYELTDEFVEEIAQNVVKVASTGSLDTACTPTQPFFDKKFKNEIESEESKRRNITMMEEDLFLEKNMAKAVEFNDEEE